MTKANLSISAAETINNLQVIVNSARPFYRNLTSRETEDQKEKFLQLDTTIRIYLLHLGYDLQEITDLSFEEVFDALNEFLQINPGEEGSVIPSNLKELVAAYESAQSKENFVKNLEDTLEYCRKIAEIRKALNRTQIVPPEIKPAEAQQIIQNFVDNLEEDLAVTAQRPEVQKIIQDRWEKFIDGRVGLSQEEQDYFKSRQISQSTAQILAQESARPPTERNTSRKLIEDVVLGNKAFETQKIDPLINAGIALNAVNLVPFAQEVIDLKGNAQEQAAETLKNKVHEVVFFAVADAAEEITQLGQEFSPDQTLNLIANKAQQTTKVIMEAASGKEFILPPPAILPPFFNQETLFGGLPVNGPVPKGNPNSDPLQTELGNKSFSQRVVSIFGREGINQRSIAKIDSEVLQLKMVATTIRGIPSQQIDSRFETQARRVSSDNINQLRSVVSILKKYQNSLPTPLREKLFDNRLKELFSLGRKVTPLAERFENKVKEWFFKTGLGSVLKLEMEKAGQKSLQKLFELYKPTVKTAITKAVAKWIGTFLIKLGFKGLANLIANSLAPIIGFIIVEVGTQILKWGTKALKAIARFTFSESGAPKYAAFLSLEVVCSIVILVVILGFPLISFFLNLPRLAFLPFQSGPAREFLTTNLLPLVKPQCKQPRHLAEKIICSFTEGFQCNFDIIDENTWEKVNRCLSQSPFLLDAEIKKAIKNTLFRFLIPIVDGGKKNLQCVGFVTAVEAAQGRTLEKVGNARDYLYPPYPPGYQFIPGQGAMPETGDIAIWKGSTYGHIAVVIAKDNDKKRITIAEANGYNGQVSIRENIPFGDLLRYPGYCPDGFLRYQKL